MALNIVFMGTPEFSVPTLNSLIDSEHNLKMVVTMPDKPKGRGKKLASPPVKDVCIKKDINVHQPTDLKDKIVYNSLKEVGPDLIITMAYGKFIPDDILKLPSLDCINVHASLLPKYRGAAPIHWAVINGEKETGLTIMSMNSGMDTGDILTQLKIPIGFEDTTGDVHDRLAEEAPSLLLETIRKLETGKITPLKQNDKKACFAPKLTDKYIKINWENEAALNIYNKIRGLNPWPGSYTYWQNKRIKIWESKIHDRIEKVGIPGEVIKKTKEGPMVQCKEGFVVLTCLQPEGRKKLSGEDFLKGYSMKTGEVIGEN